MRRVWRKIKSNSGASLLFALLVFMLCVLAGTAALTAAAANSGRYTHMKAEQQDYLSVASAARVVKDELVDGTFTANFSGVNRDKPTPVTDGGFTSNCNLGSVFGETFKDYFIHLYKIHGWTPSTVYIMEEIFTSSVGDSWSGTTPPKKTMKITGVDGMSEVTLVLEADENFTITATLYTGDETEPINKTVIELVGDPTWTEDTKSERYYYAIPATTPGTQPGVGVGTKTTVVRNLSVKWTLENVTVYDGGRKE